MIPAPTAGNPITVAEALDRNPLPADAPNHETGLDSADVIERLKLIGPGENYEVIPADHPLAVKGLISHVYRRLDPDKPSYTVIAGGGGGTHGYHHIEPRRLSNREKARLQGFPDDFVSNTAAGPARLEPHRCTPGCAARSATPSRPRRPSHRRCRRRSPPAGRRPARPPGTWPPRAEDSRSCPRRRRWPST